MIINFVKETHTLWHSSCEEGGHTSPMKEVLAGENRTLLECTGCGKRGYYPHGQSGLVHVAELKGSARHP